MENFCSCQNYQEKQKLTSEIVESNQPYKEIEAVINNSRLVLRSQKLAPVKNKEKEKVKDTKNIILGNLTDKPVRLLLAEVRNAGTSKSKTKIDDESIRNSSYLLRIKKTESWDENIDLELRIPK